MIFAAILAGGIGSRMNVKNKPKQFFDLNNKPVIIHTIEKFLMCKRIDYIYIGIHSEWLLYMKDILNKYKINENKVIVISGGNNRNNTLLNIINKIQKNYTINNKDIIITHDAVRPFVSLDIINKNIDMMIDHDACNTVIPVTDTMILSENKINIDKVLCRESLFRVQTPQTFNMSLLKTFLNNLSEEDKEKFTDACSIFIKNKKSVYLVEGNINNMKLTTIDDYNIAKVLINLI